MGQLLLTAIGLLVEWPVSVLVRLFVPTKFRKTVHLFLGLCLGFLLYRSTFLLVLLGTTLAYPLLFLPNRLCLVTLVVPLFGLFAVHLIRVVTFDDSKWSTDVSGIVMFHALRLWMLAFNVSDGRRRVDLRRKEWIRLALNSVPSFFEYMTYMYSYNGLYSGPLIPIQVFDEICAVEGDSESVRCDIRSGFFAYVHGIFWGVVNLVSNRFFPNTMIESDEFNALPWVVRWVVSFVVSAGRNMRYVFAWLVAEAGYRTLGADRLTDFDFEDWRSIRVAKFWTGRCLPDLAAEWHHCAHTVFKEYIHVRMIASGISRQVGKIVTFAFSAYWHGFYSGYYLLAMLEAIMAPFDEFRRDRFSPLVEKVVGKRAARVADMVFVQMFNFWMGAPWDLYWAPRYWRFYCSMQFGPIIMVFVCDAIALIFGSKPKRQQEEKTKKQD
jgi:hypothetical protein